MQTVADDLKVRATRSLFVCVGDLSADRHAGKLITKLKNAVPEIDIWGVGGDNMQAAGARLLYNRESLAVLGIVEVIRYLPKLIAMRQQIIKEVSEKKPDAILLMDFGGFNVGLATQLRKKLPQTPIIYFISPQVWGSRPWRIQVIKKFVTRMLVIFPFEEPLYKSIGVDARFVGHPLTISFTGQTQDRESFFAAHGLDKDKPLVGIFPGSRRQEIKGHSQIVLAAADWLTAERPDMQFVVSTTNQDFADAFYKEIERLGYNRLVGKQLKTISSEHNQDLMIHSDILWTKSGTTTLEATLAGTPMLLFYHANWVTFLIFLIFKTIKNVGWPNLLAGEEIIPELIQLDCRADQLVRYTRDWLDTPGLRKELSDRLRNLRLLLGEGDFTENAAREILNVLGIADISAEEALT